MNQKRKLVYATTLAMAAGSVLAYSQSRQVVAPPGSLIPGIPMSPAVRFGDLLHIGGTMGTDASGNLVHEGIEGQTKKALENIGVILKAGGMDYKDVVAVNVFLADARDFDGMNKVYRNVFKINPPTRATVQADLMLRDGLVEISAIAVRDDLPRRYINPQGWSTNPLPYSRAIVAGDYIFMSGMLSQNPQTGAAVPGDTGTQTKQILDNAKTLVEAAGFKISDLAFSRVYLTDARDFQMMNDAYGGYFSGIPPTRATLRAGLTASDYKVEIMMWGMKGERQRIGAAGPSPYSQAIRIGNKLFISGLVDSNAQTHADVKGQGTAILSNIQGILKQNGMDFPNVLESNIYIADSRNFSLMNEAYTQFIKSDAPTRFTIGVGLMAPEDLIEIAMIAAK